MTFRFLYLELQRVWCKKASLFFYILKNFLEVVSHPVVLIPASFFIMDKASLILNCALNSSRLQHLLYFSLKYLIRLYTEQTFCKKIYKNKKWQGSDRCNSDFRCSKNQKKYVKCLKQGNFVSICKVGFFLNIFFCYVVIRLKWTSAYSVA